LQFPFGVFRFRSLFEFSFSNAKITHENGNPQEKL
jgi:hypothetical protein